MVGLALLILSSCGGDDPPPPPERTRGRDSTPEASTGLASPERRAMTRSEAISQQATRRSVPTPRWRGDPVSPYMSLTYSLVVIPNLAKFTKAFLL